MHIEYIDASRIYRSMIIDMSIYSRDNLFSFLTLSSQESKNRLSLSIFTVVI